MVQFDAELHFLQNGTTTTLYDALTPLPLPYFVFHFGYGANYFWCQLFNIGLINCMWEKYDRNILIKHKCMPSHGGFVDNDLSPYGSFLFVSDEHLCLQAVAQNECHTN
jgi:hypothetical protein